MVFSSLIFLFYFLPAALLVYHLSPDKLKNMVLFAASLVFYAWGEPVYIVLLLFSTLFDYANGLLIDKYRGRRLVSRMLLIFSLCGNVAILGFFKYAGFVADSIAEGFGLYLSIADLPLPIGLSFYTFQTMSYVIDVYRGKVPSQRNLIAFGTYVAMFPQLVAGPIVKYGEIADQLISRRVTTETFGEGAGLFIGGLFKKVVLANNIGLLWASVKSTPLEELSVLSAWLGIVAFTLQIYFDFSGYSDMARGLGKMFGFEFPLNFSYPYMARSITAFWRKWHMTLGGWFRDYVYIPLGGNRRGLRLQLRNILIVWALTGLWHGASWNFVIWGLYFGMIVTLEKMVLLKRLSRWPRVAGHMYTMLLVIIGWVLFEYEHVPSAGTFVATLFGFSGQGLTNMQAWYDLRTYGVWVLLLVLAATPLPRLLLACVQSRWKQGGAWLVAACYVFGLVLATAYLVNDTYNPFLYFRF